MALRFARERGVLGIADGDQHVADEAVAADALDGRAGEQAPEGGIVEPRQLGEPRRIQLVARLELGLRGASSSGRACSFVSRAALANLFHGQTARQSSQP
jgi:hypothetical protein